MSFGKNVELHRMSDVRIKNRIPLIPDPSPAAGRGEKVMRWSRVDFGSSSNSLLIPLYAIIRLEAGVVVNPGVRGDEPVAGRPEW